MAEALAAGASARAAMHGQGSRCAHAHPGRRCHDSPVNGVYVKEREPARPGSIPERLQMFVREVRFYEEVAPHVGIRVPACYRAEVADDGSTRLELEDLSEWSLGATPEAGGATLQVLHETWQGKAVQQWPWLPRAEVSDLVEQLFAARWPAVRERADLALAARDLGDRLLGRVAEAGRLAGTAGPATLVHGDPSAVNMRTSPTGEVALLDWEDVDLGPGVCDLAWHLLAGVEAGHWDEAIAAYGSAAGLERALPAACVQALLSLSGEPEGSTHAHRWVAAVAEAAARI
jgi:hypothetical protein